MYNNEMSPYNNGSKAKQHIPFNKSVYAPLNKCNFIPNCAYEVEYLKDYFGNNGVVCIYQSDNGKYLRAVYSLNNNNIDINIAGMLFNATTGEIIWSEVCPTYRGKGIYKQLKAIIPIITGIKVWSQFQTNDLLKACNISNCLVEENNNDQ